MACIYEKKKKIEGKIKKQENVSVRLTDIGGEIRSYIQKCVREGWVAEYFILFLFVKNTMTH